MLKIPSKEIVELPAERAMIEFTNACNYSCVMCANRVMRRKRRFMTMDTYINAISKIKDAGISSLLFWTVGETLLHPQAVEMINSANKLGFDEMIITTNGSMLKTEDDVIRLLSSGINTIRFSFFGYDKNSFEKVYVGGSFKKIVYALTLLNKYANEYGVVLNVNGVNMFNDDAYAERTLGFLSDIGIEKKRITIVKPDNFAGKIKPIDACRELPNEIPYCYQLKRFSVLNTGDVTACGCFDVDAEMIVGNINKHNVQQIREGKKFQKVLRCFNKNKIHRLKMCRNCNMLTKFL